MARYGQFMTIVSKKQGVCRRCGEEIPVGVKIRWSRTAGAYHLVANCPGSPEFVKPASTLDVEADKRFAEPTEDEWIAYRDYVNDCIAEELMPIGMPQWLNQNRRARAAAAARYGEEL